MAWSSEEILLLISIEKMAVPTVVPMDLRRLTADVVIPISRVVQLFWTAVMMTAIIHPSPNPKMNRHSM